MTDNPMTDETRDYLAGTNILDGADRIAMAEEDAQRHAQFFGYSRDQLERELVRYESSGPSGLARRQIEAGAEARCAAIRELLAEMIALGITSWPPPRPESETARRIRESIEKEDAQQLERETQEPATDIATALAQREKALSAIDKAVDHIGKAVGMIRDADRIILETRPGKDIRTWFNLGHISERLQRRLGDIGIAPDMRDDKGKPSPLLVELAGAHSFISDHLK